jgi:hypothetical protein
VIGIGLRMRIRPYADNAAPAQQLRPPAATHPRPLTTTVTTPRLRRVTTARTVESLVHNTPFAQFPHRTVL